MPDATGEDALDDRPTHRNTCGDPSVRHTVVLSRENVHYLTEIAIIEIENNGRTRGLLHGTADDHLTGRMKDLFDSAKADYEDRGEREGRGRRFNRRFRINDRTAREVLVSVYELHSGTSGIVAKSMRDLARTLADQLGIRWEDDAPVDDRHQTPRFD